MWINKIRVIFLFFFVAFLVACNGSKSDNDSIPVSVQKPVVSDVIQSQYWNNKEKQSYSIDLNKKIYDIQGLPLNIDDYSVIGKGCKATFNGLSLSITADKETVCSVNYNVRNTPDDVSKSQSNHGVVTAVFSSYEDPYLQTISKSATVNNTIEINLKEELGAFFPTGGKLSSDYWQTESDASININSETNTIEIDASEQPEVIQVRYEIELPDKTVKFGIVTVTISDDLNLAPIAKDKYVEVDSSLTPLTVDVTDLISDDDDDVSDLQIIKIDSFDDVAVITEPDNLHNKKFNVDISKAGLYDINYIISDHHGGYASSIIRVKVNEKTYWDDIIISSGVLYTAPWEQVGADKYGLPYQRLVDYSLDGNLFHIPMFNYASAEAICQLRGMVIPTLRQLQDLFGEIGNVQVERNWPNDKFYWTSSNSDTLNTKDAYSLLTGTVKKNQKLSEPYFLTCVLPGTLSVKVTKDNSYTALDSASVNYDEVTATVLDSNKDVLADSVVYLYMNDPDLMLENQIGFTNVDGIATFKVRSKKQGEHLVTVSYYSQKINQKLNFLPDSVENYLLKPGDKEINVKESLLYQLFKSYTSGIEVLVPSKNVHWETKDTTIATVDNSLSNPGLVTGVEAGKTFLNAWPSGDKDHKASVTITVQDPVTSWKLVPDNQEINVNETYQFHFFEVHLSGDEVEIPAANVHWEISKGKDYASVDNTYSNPGLVKGLSVGSATLLAHISGNKDQKATAEISVVDPVASWSLNPPNASIKVTKTQAFTFHEHYKSGGDVVLPASDVTWQIIAGNTYATVNQSGIVTGRNAGTATLKATSKKNSSHFATATITVEEEPTTPIRANAELNLYGGKCTFTLQEKRDFAVNDNTSAKGCNYSKVYTPVYGRRSGGTEFEDIYHYHITKTSGAIDSMTITGHGGYTAEVAYCTRGGEGSFSDNKGGNYKVNCGHFSSK
ncbi:Ig-like domain-containing protein [Photobacterium damselae]|uniref:Ig-like domain-containing protein n=1 Tax=Photobacterium damselae TaxID=38293 RepID=UPI001EFDF5BC|nr:Ig-like domain-containing protein [Photobacterium damselae]MCG9778829.1 Ig-like domain-containing protein [Photobacterium damselae]